MPGKPTGTHGTLGVVLLSSSSPNPVTTRPDGAGDGDTHGGSSLLQVVSPLTHLLKYHFSL